jgi:hypothetical protein
MDSSHLSRLAPELRNLIYEFTFTSNFAVTLKSGGNQHALTMTCRQIRHETLGLYHSISRFNAHLDDGPAIPLARWLRAIGRENCLLLDEVNIWDMHMLNATLHGEDVTQRLLKSGTCDGKAYVLQPLGSWLLKRGWYLKDIVLALHSIDLSLARLCVTTQPGEDVSMTSHFAIVRSNPQEAQDEQAQLEALCDKLGCFDERMRKQLILELADGQQEVRLRHSRRDIVLQFEGLGLISLRQEFIPHDEDFGP